MRVSLLAGAAVTVLVGTFGATAVRALPSLERAQVEASPEHPARAVVSDLLRKLPVAFEANIGQTDSRVDFLARCDGYMAFVMPNELVLALPVDGLGIRPDDVADHAQPTRESALRMVFVGAHARAAHPARRLPGHSSYLKGDDPAAWLAAAPHYERVEYSDVWEGVDLRYDGDERRVRFRLDVAAGVDPGVIALSFSGAEPPSVDDEGRLHLVTPGGAVVLSAPVLYQEPPSGRSLVTGGWELRRGDRVGFRAGPYDAALPLVIDPTVEYSTYIGGTQNEEAPLVALDDAGKLYVAGATRSADFPTTAGAYQVLKKQDSSSTPRLDAFVVKLNAKGDTLEYGTFFGGTLEEWAYGLDVDSAGAAHVLGGTLSTDLPVLGALESTHTTSGWVGFLVKLNANGTGLVYSTYLNYGFPRAMSLDTSGSPYVVLDNALMRVMKLNAAGTSSLYTTDLGVSGGNDRPTDISVDASGNAHLVGYTESANFSTTSSAYQTKHGGLFDGFVIKLDSAGKVLFSTLLGDIGREFAWGITVDGSGTIYLTGYTESKDFPITEDAYDDTLSGGRDGFLAKLASTGSELEYSTFLGGDRITSAYDVEVCSCGATYVVGYTQATDFPTTEDAYQEGNEGGYDVFLTVFRCDNSLLYSSLFGGAGTDQSLSVAVGADGHAYVGGDTFSTDFPTENAYEDEHQGVWDAVVVSVSGILEPFLVTTETIPPWSQDVEFSHQLTKEGGTGAVTWSLADGSAALPDGLTMSENGELAGTPTVAGDFPFKAALTDFCGIVVTKDLTVTVNPPPSIAAAGPFGWTDTRPFSEQFLVSDGTPPITWSIDGDVPGLEFSETALLDGIPTEPGNYAFTVEVVDVRGATDSLTVAMTVNPVPELLTTDMPDCTETVVYNQPLQTRGGTAPLTWLVSGVLPTTNPLVTESPAVTGPGRSAGNYRFTIEITDARGATAQRSYQMTLNPFPRIITDELPLGAEGRPYGFALDGSGGTGTTMWSRGSGLPPGLGLSESDGRLSGSPSRPGHYEFKAQYIDSCLAVGEKNLEMDVAGRFDLARKRATEVLEYELLTSREPRLYYFDLVKGTKLSLTVKLLGKRGKLPLELALLDENAQGIGISQYVRTGKKAVKLRNYPVTDTGRYFLRVTAGAPFEGRVRVTAQPRFPRSMSGRFEIPAAGSDTDLDLASVPGSRLVFSVKAARRSRAQPTITAILDGGTDVLVPLELRERGHSAKVNARTPLGGGSLVIRLTNRGVEAGDVTWRARFRVPRIYDFVLDEDP